MGSLTTSLRTDAAPIGVGGREGQTAGLKSQDSNPSSSIESQSGLDLTKVQNLFSYSRLGSPGVGMGCASSVVVAAADPEHAGVAGPAIHPSRTPAAALEVGVAAEAVAAAAAAAGGDTPPEPCPTY